MKKQDTREPQPAEKPPATAEQRAGPVPLVPRTPYRDRPTDDGTHGDGAADPSGVGDQGGSEQERQPT
jgi:hypothetical protein